MNHVVLVLAVLLLFPSTSPASDRPTWREGKPRLARLYMAGDLTPARVEQERYREFELVVVSPRLESSNPGVLNALHRVNPHATVLVIYNLVGVFENWREHPQHTFAFSLGEQTALRRLWMPVVGQTEAARGRGPAVHLWPGLSLANATHPLWPETWSRVVATHLRGLQSGTRGRLGVLIDDCWSQVSWIPRREPNAENGIRLDADGDGLEDDARALDAAWTGGITATATALAERTAPACIVANGAHALAGTVTGRMWENVGTIGETDIDALLADAAAYPGEARHIVHVTPDQLDLGLAVTLLRDDLYLAVSETAFTHRSRVWDARMDIEVGEPLGPAVRTNGVWVRRYTKARVGVDVSAATGVVVPSDP